jgi:predicted  nucleic acid-binding Zn-ribbon protein
MEHYNIYRNLKSEIKKKKAQLSDLKKISVTEKNNIEELETSIEEDINGLNMVFDYIISQKRN